jgi:hypothetical protein
VRRDEPTAREVVDGRHRKPHQLATSGAVITSSLVSGWVWIASCKRSSAWMTDTKAEPARGIVVAEAGRTVAGTGKRIVRLRCRR